MEVPQFLRDCYGLLLKLYPKTYREEYGDELQAVFNLSLGEALKMGRINLASLLLRELTGLPRAILYEHLRERRSKMTGKFASRFDFPQGSRTEPWVVLLPFALTYVLYRAMLFLNPSSMPFWVELVIGLTFLGSIFGMFIAGLRMGAPRWFLPYLGFVLSIINLFTYTAYVRPDWSGFPFLNQASRFVRGFVYQGTVWIGVIVLVILLVLFAASIPKFRPFYQRLRDDWTLLAFTIYGVAPFAIILTFDDYQGEGLYVLIANSILAIGGWSYLRTQIPWKRYVILFIGLALSMSVAAVGKWILYNPILYTPAPGLKFSEMMSTVTLWVWLALFMLTPLALKLLPRSEATSSAA